MTPERGRNDFAQIAFRVVTEATEGKPADEDGKNPAAVALGRLGGRKGGKARMALLSAEERSEMAKRAAQARWRKPRA